MARHFRPLFGISVQPDNCIQSRFCHAPDALQEGPLVWIGLQVAVHEYRTSLLCHEAYEDWAVDEVAVTAGLDACLVGKNLDIRRA